MNGKTATRGYILLETVAAMVVLSIGIVGIEEGIRQSIITRGQARDYTQARFMLEDLIERLEIQPVLFEETKSGGYDDKALSRFHWQYTIRRIYLPTPTPPKGLPRGINMPRQYMGKIEAVITWTRHGRTFRAEGQTLIDPKQLYVPDANS